jgi:hypothetical protein
MTHTLREFRTNPVFRTEYKLLTVIITNEISDYLKILTFSPINELGASVFTAEQHLIIIIFCLSHQDVAEILPLVYPLKYLK